MDKTVLNILFNYNGKITAREFRVGSTIMFLAIGVYINVVFENMLTSVISARFGTEYLYSHIMFKSIMSTYVPHLVPTSFILAYSAFVLGLKRVRSLTENCAVSLLSGIVNYLFFASILAFIQLSGSSIDSYQTYPFTPYLLIIIATLIVIGIANLIVLSIAKQSENSKQPQIYRRLDILSFALKLEKLIAISILIGVAVFVIFLTNPFIFLLLKAFHIDIVAVILLLGLLFFYIKYIIYRLHDAGKSVWWLVGILGAYLIVTALRVYIMHIFAEIFYIFDIFYSIVTNLFIASQFILFLLPSKEENPPLSRDFIA